MGDETAISLRNVGKCYKRYPRPVDRLKEILLPGKSRLEEFWALRDIDLEVPKGQTLGIIGRNGSGKSTLLQIIAGTLQPTTGEVKVNGRVSALLELGSGFNPEFTGRQNVFFNGRLLGLNQQEIEEKFDEVAGFADIGDFIDQPVKTYSSGMFVRLAFAVAVNVNPEILIVDEALSVGDGIFVHRCMSKIKDFQDYGGTLLFVSHDTGAVTRLCSNAVWLNDGKIIESGNPYKINKHYQAWTYAQINDYQKSQGISSSLNETNGKVSEQSQETLIRENLNPYTQTPFSSFKHVERFGTGTAEIIDFKVVDSNNESAEYVYPGNWIKMIVKVLTHAQIESPIVGIMLYDRLRMPVTGFNTSQYRHKLDSVSANQILNIEFELEWPEIQGGNYALEPAIANGSQENHEMIDWLQFPLNIVSGATELTFGLIRLQNIKITHNLVGLYPSLKPILAEVEINSKSHLL